MPSSHRIFQTIFKECELAYCSNATVMNCLTPSEPVKTLSSRSTMEYSERSNLMFDKFSFVVILFSRCEDRIYWKVASQFLCRNLMEKS